MSSFLELQREVILRGLREVRSNEYKVLVLDEESRKVVFNAVAEKEILNIATYYEQIEEKRHTNREVDAIYVLTAEPHIVECLISDFDRRRYNRAFILWLSPLNGRLREKIDHHPAARPQIGMMQTLHLDFSARESHLALFNDPSSFTMLYHPACNSLVRAHLESIAQKVLSVCICLGENPIIRYFKPRSPRHDASVLPMHLANFIQRELDAYANYHPDWPPPNKRGRGIMVVTDRSMDVWAPLLHEFTYQAMAHDLLAIQEGEKVTYKTTVNQGEQDEETKDMEINESDKIWIENRHRHMLHTIDKLTADFNKFMQDNAAFSDKSGKTNLHQIRGMMAGLAEFQEKKSLYSLHLTMANECMALFEKRKLPDVALLEQSMATGLDDQNQRPKQLPSQLVRLLDDDAVDFTDRLRLIAQYTIYKDGIFPGDREKLMAHAQLRPNEGEIIENLDMLGVASSRALKDKRPVPAPLFPRTAPYDGEDTIALSRYQPALKAMLADQLKGTLDPMLFPFVKGTEAQAEAQEMSSQASLRKVQPQWARKGMGANEPRQRIIVMMAGGATYSESRTCYEMTMTSGKEVFLVSSHMITPKLFVRQVGGLSEDRRRLDLPIDRAPKNAPAHLFEPEPKPVASPPVQQPQQGLAPATTAMSSLSLNSSSSRVTSPPAQKPSSFAKPEKKEEKKKKHFFSSKK